LRSFNESTSLANGHYGEFSKIRGILSANFGRNETGDIFLTKSIIFV